MMAAMELETSLGERPPASRTHGDPGIPRLWIGPRGEVVPCDEGVGHAEVALMDPEAFGLDDVRPRDLRHPDGEINFDYVLALAARHGWARISRDTGGACSMAVAAGERGMAMKAIRHMASLGHAPGGIALELFRISGDLIHTESYALAGRDLDMFRRSGSIRAKGRVNAIPTLADWDEGDEPDEEAVSSATRAP
jgi:hypothetical protein